MPIFQVSVDVLRNGRRCEIVKVHEELNLLGFVINEILKKEVVHVTAKVVEQREELTVPLQHVAKWTVLRSIMATDALERQVEPVGDLTTEPSGSVDSLFSVDPVSRKDHHPADRIAYGPKLFVLHLWELADDALHYLPPRERWDY